MKLAALELRPYHLPLKQPWRSAAGVRRERIGWLLTAAAEARTGYGECAPLPEAGTETHESADAALTRWTRLLQGMDVRGALEVVGAEAIPSCTRFALETALFDLEAQAAGLPLARHLEADAGTSVRVNAALGALDGDVAERAAGQFAAGFRVLKLKVGLAAPLDEAAQLSALAARCPGALFRLDANRAWREDEAMLFIAAIGGLSVESLEEPLREPTPEALARVQAAAAFPLALDESLTTADGSALAAGMRRLVLKPGALGGLRRALAWADSHHAECVVTTMIEGACATLAAAHLAAVVDARRGARTHGLATADWLAADLGSVSSVTGGTLQLPPTSGIGFSACIA